ncbi:MAG: nucleotidyltransferase domain-containing protein [Bacteroidota bacterium]|nr:nucleotidyltransferase domain-containing protein [Bacteroidota bacterium]
MPDNKYQRNLEEQVLNTLLYFDIFNYPLKASEIFKFLKTKLNTVEDLTGCLNELAGRKYIFAFGDFYSLENSEEPVKRRIRGNAEAGRWMPVALKKAQFISRFPFVRAVLASGSLSKGYMDENSDLDFFIVTAPGRMWIARTLLVLYKRIFLLNSHKQFCVNYFVDSDHLEIEEKNLFTATELITLVPLCDYASYRAILRSNPWVAGFFPNFRPQIAREDNDRQGRHLKKVSELLLTPVAQLLDRFFMALTFRRWNKMYASRYSRADFAIAFKTRRYVSKNHPNHYQKKILERYDRKIEEFRNRLPQPSMYE